MKLKQQLEKKKSAPFLSSCLIVLSAAAWLSYSGRPVPVAPPPEKEKTHWMDTTIKWGERLVKAAAITAAL